MRIALACLLVAACADDGPASFGDVLDDPEVPPRGAVDLPSWLAAGHYVAWSCEPAAHAPRAGSPHGANRICSNAALVASIGPGPYPQGAAAVKELVDDAGGIELYAVYRKTSQGDGGDTWYWFEGSADRVIANGEGDDACVGCHASAPRDFVFTLGAP